MKPILTLLTLALALASATALSAQEKALRYSAAFWNVENLCDTLRSDFYDDSDFTPSGRYGWNTERYNRKIANIARVIDQMNADCVGLAEVENESVVRDLVKALKTGYCYIFRTTSDRRGMDLALLYRPDRIFPKFVEQIPLGSTREALHVVCTLSSGDETDFVIWHAPSKLNERAYRRKALAGLRAAADSLTASGAKLIIMGDMNSSPNERIFRKSFGDGVYRSPVSEATDIGGSYFDTDRWILMDNILIGPRTALAYNFFRGGIFVRDYMLWSGKKAAKCGCEGTPKRTFDAASDYSGYSDHLPVFLIWGE